jgi:uncharacterized protein (TIGR03435 family)
LYRTTIAEFATEFSDRLDRPVIDKTGIAGLFNIDLDLINTDLSPVRSSEASATATDPNSIVDAVRRAVRKLGLRLDPGRGPGEFLVVDNIERPTEN